MKSATLDHRALRWKREMAGLTQEALAKKVGVDRTMACHWEAGRAQPNAANFKKLCRALKAKPADLLIGPTKEAA